MDAKVIDQVPKVFQVLRVLLSWILFTKRPGVSYRKDMVHKRHQSIFGDMIQPLACHYYAANKKFLSYHHHDECPCLHKALYQILPLNFKIASTMPLT